VEGGGYLRVAGGKWVRRPGAPQQHRQPSADPPSPDSTDLKISAYFNVNSTSSRSSIMRTLGLGTSWAPRRNSTKASAPSFKEPPLPSTPSFWECVATSTTITHWSFLRGWVLTLKELANLLPSSMYTLSTTQLLNLFVPGVPFPVSLSTLIRSQFQAKKPATLSIPNDTSILNTYIVFYDARAQTWNETYPCIKTQSTSGILNGVPSTAQKSVSPFFQVGQPRWTR